MKKALFAAAIFIAAFTFLAAELNYMAALNAAKATNGSDSTINEAMSKHGFTTDAADPAPISIITKVKALTNF